MKQSEFDFATRVFAAKKMEGKLFTHIALFQIGDKSRSIIVNKDYYTVRNGEVFMVNSGEMQPTGDTLLSIVTDCHCVGKYHPEKTYKRKRKEYTYSEFCKLNKF